MLCVLCTLRAGAATYPGAGCSAGQDGAVQTGRFHLNQLQATVSSPALAAGAGVQAAAAGQLPQRRSHTRHHQLGARCLWADRASAPRTGAGALDGLQQRRNRGWRQHFGQQRASEFPQLEFQQLPAHQLHQVGVLCVGRVGGRAKHELGTLFSGCERDLLGVIGAQQACGQPPAVCRQSRHRMRSVAAGDPCICHPPSPQAAHQLRHEDERRRGRSQKADQPSVHASAGPTACGAATRAGACRRAGRRCRRQRACGHRRAGRRRSCVCADGFHMRRWGHLLLAQGGSR